MSLCFLNRALLCCSLVRLGILLPWSLRRCPSTRALSAVALAAVRGHCPSQRAQMTAEGRARRRQWEARASHLGPLMRPLMREGFSLSRAPSRRTKIRKRSEDFPHLGKKRELLCTINGPPWHPYFFRFLWEAARGSEQQSFSLPLVICSCPKFCIFVGPLEFNLVGFDSFTGFWCWQRTIWQSVDDNFFLCLICELPWIKSRN